MKEQLIEILNPIKENSENKEFPEIELILQTYEIKVPSHKLNDKLIINQDAEGSIYYITKSKVTILNWIVFRVKLIFIYIKVRLGFSGIRKYNLKNLISKVKDEVKK